MLLRQTEGDSQAAVDGGVHRQQSLENQLLGCSAGFRFPSAARG